MVKVASRWRDPAELGSSHAFKIPKKYIPDYEERQKQEMTARLAESTAKLVESTNYWKETYGPLPA